MSELQFTREKGRKQTRCILHKVADIPGGVGVDPASLNNDYLLEGTPLAIGSNGLYKVVANAVLVNPASTTDTSIRIQKGSHLKAGTVILGATVQTINKSNADYDVVTLDKGLSAAQTVGTTIGETANVVAVCGTEKNVKDRGNIFVDAWVIAVLQKSNAPLLTSTQKDTAPTLVYV